jgi:hypothetical protein
MNERIRELAEQASKEAFPVGSMAWMETFAESIVKECIDTLEENIHRSIDNEGDEIWADLILKEHFGVEL